SAAPFNRLMEPSCQVAAPRLTSARPSRVWLPAPSMVSVAPAATVVVPSPVIVLACQSSDPVTVKSPAPASLAAGVNPALLEELVARASVPPDSTSAAWLDRLLIESLTPLGWVTVIPVWLMTTSSAAPGRAPVLQLPGVSQLESPAAPVQVTTAGDSRSSRAS